MIKHFLLLICSILLTSCVILPDEYFYPQAEGASAERELCHGSVGAKSKLVYELDDVKVDFSVGSVNSLSTLYISIRVYDDSNAIWPAQTITAYADSNELSLKLDHFTRYRYVDRYNSSEIESIDYPSNTVMDRADHEDKQRLYFREYYESYVSSVELTDISIEELRIEAIKIIVRGKEHLLEDILFTKTKGIFLYPLNC
ncbi:hypothetical protein A3749_19465 [Oleiphilus sp. HI0078]|uniref:hypothetical protein n=1 Tax=unclassified Oleiphilus TaxID=2631174 RepID=UPI0007C2751F|nr:MULTISPECIES: hypothetical protein [unclassified Oleiphilus]KZY85636.1 hypothetical protein A3743_18825 [Oleiphilus sp. HI0072]KZZ20291.1 hypothetical protein A3749_19465 [Oleiphilus sp. HI0078]KZY34360.1 hypothetical protein A3729_18345 [Oleiphilus sp. HI0043]KZY57836.1 hypothetical protein A3735_18310 [Oleiphilus sp. HI0061]KZZ66124.1 hypothetical protein A3763_17975 [Oleiphilus sp. HI0128]